MKNRILPQSILLLYFCIFLSVSASAQNVRVTLKMENEKMETVMDAIYNRRNEMYKSVKRNVQKFIFSLLFKSRSNAA